MKCLNCDKEVEISVHNKKFCSKHCRWAYNYRKQYVPKPKIEKSCKECGETFLGSERKRYCSRRCLSRHKSKEHYYKHGKGKGVCKQCKKEYTKTNTHQTYCSLKCSGIASRKYLDIPDCLENADRKLDKNLGYVRVYVPMHPEANTWGYVYEHRVVAEQMIGRRLLKDEVVHHKNGKRWDNSEDNLEVMDKREHSKLKR